MASASFISLVEKYDNDEYQTNNGEQGLASNGFGDFVVNGIWYTIVDDDEVSITGYTEEFSGDLTDEQVEYEAKNYTVTSIGEESFAGCTNLTTVTMNSVTYIGQNAFSGCTNLTILVMDSVARIGAWAFASCTNLTTVTMNSVTIIGSCAFYGCTNLTTVTMNSVTGIGYQAFFYCTSLTTINVDSDNEYFVVGDDNVLYNKDKSELVLYPAGLENTSYTAPDSVLFVRGYAFYGCTNLTTVTMNSLENIPEWVFWNTNLTTVTINSVTSIGYQAFAFCTNLTTVTANSATVIGYQAFYGCTNLTTVTMNSLESVDQIFRGHGNLTTVTMNSVTDIGEGSFAACTSLTTVTMNSVTSIGDGAFARCSSLTTVTMNSLESIPERMFSDCPNLTTVTMNSVTDIGREAFALCTNLTTVTMDSVISIGGYAFFGCMNLTTVTMNSVIDIGREAFSWCTSLTTVTMDSVTDIGIQAFLWCTSLTTVTLNSVTDIGSGAFSGCTSLTTVTLNSVTSIGDYAFFGCTNLTTINIDPDNEYFAVGNDNVLYNKDKSEIILYSAGLENTSYTVPDTVLVIRSGAFSYASLTTVTMNSVTSIGAGAFASCTNLTTVTMNSATSIGEGSFASCTNLTTVTMDSVIDIGREAFSWCTSLIQITIPSSVMGIGWKAFYGCTSLTTVTMDSVTYIEGEAFSDCTSLTTVTMNSVTDIGGRAFYGCTSLIQITIPSSVTVIGWEAFYGCTSLTAIAIPSEAGSYGIQQGAVIVFYQGEEVTSATATMDGDLVKLEIVTAGGKEVMNLGLTHGVVIWSVDNIFWIDAQGATEIWVSINMLGDGCTCTLCEECGGCLLTDPGCEICNNECVPCECCAVCGEYPCVCMSIPITYTVTVISGTGSGPYSVGYTVHIVADPAPEGMIFDKWTTSDGVSFWSVSGRSASFTMPERDVTVTATYKVASSVPYHSDGVFTNDPLIQGNMGIGSTFTYDIVDLDSDFGHTYADTATLTIIGESGSYYFVLIEFKFESQYSTSGETYTMGLLAMIHKHTGELRFSSFVGNDTIEYEGDTISLQKWEWKNNMQYGDGSHYETITFSSNPSDAIPYKIEVTTGSPHSFGTMDTFSLVLTEYDIVTVTEPFVPSEDMGTGFVYFVSSPSQEDLQAEHTMMIVADGVLYGENVRFVLVYLWLSPNDYTHLEYGIIFFSILPAGAGWADDIIGEGYEVIEERTESLSTIDGDVLCNVITYQSIYSPWITVVYHVGLNGVVYSQAQYYNGELIDRYDLIRYLSQNSSATYTVTVNGTVSGSYETGATVTLTQGTPPAGKEFDRWDVVGTGASVSGSVLTVGTSNVTATVIWKDIVYNVTVTGGSASPTSGIMGATVTLTPGTPPVGKEFDRWNVVGTGASVNDNVLTVGTSNVTVTAVWKDVVYSVTYNLNGGTGTTPTETGKTYGATFAAPSVPTHPDGKVFKEWNTVQNPVVTNKGMGYSAGATITMPASDLVLYAVWWESPPETYAATNTVADEWTKGSVTGFATKVEGKYPVDLWSVKVNGVTLIVNEDYKVTQGSTIITLLPAFLEKLGTGNYVMDILFTDGIASTTLKVSSADAESDPMVLITVIASAVIVIAAAIFMLRKP